MELQFTKMSGAGNDFIVFNASNQNLILSKEQIQLLCDRHFGIGADGILIIKSSEKSDFDLLYFNADGSSDVLCVNGARCAIMYAYKNKIISQKCNFSFINKIYNGEIVSNNLVKINLEYNPIVKLNQTLKIDEIELNYHYVDLGSKHIIIPYETLLNKLLKFYTEDEKFDRMNIEKIGKKLRFHNDFQPDGVNVNFVLKKEGNTLSIRTYERGVEGETHACGSGSISSAIVYSVINNLNPPIFIETRSKKIFEIDFKKTNNIFNNISLIGEASIIFEGKINLQ